MANNFKRSTEAINAEANAVCALCNSGKLRVYDGLQPVDPDVAITDQNLLAELTFSATAFGAAVNGAAAANAITKDSSADRTGTATWFRAFKTDGISPVFDGTVGTTGADLNLNTVAIQANAELAITALTYTANK
jgi:hypothetical protein